MIISRLGSMYKFRFPDASRADLWFQRLKEASSLHSSRFSENLIALD